MSHHFDTILETTTFVGICRGINRVPLVVRNGFRHQKLRTPESHTACLSVVSEALLLELGDPPYNLRPKDLLGPALLPKASCPKTE